MNCKFTNVFMFAVGAAIGSAVTWKILKTKYEQLVQEEIESVKEAFSDRLTSTKEEENSESEDSEEPEEPARQINWSELEDLDEDDDDDLNEYDRLVRKYNNVKGGATNVASKPYVISPDDFGELDGYNRISLTYYSDDILEDEDGEIVTNIDELIGEKSLNTFGEYEDDSVFVRNEYLRTDFEILKDYRTYDMAHEVVPGQVDGK